MAAAASGPRKPGSPRDSEAEVWARRVRELVSSEPASRLCFECGQRGVTYVDITIGSFVCTGCSGALRGLNPPHRVKSISMTTFTESEVQFLQSRGNEACRKIWLGSFDSRTSLLPDSQDPQKVKEFLQEKYEKEGYVSPEQARGLASLTAQSSAAEVKALLGEPGPLSTGAKPAQGGALVGGFPASPASQLGAGIPDMSGTFCVGGVPSSVFGPLSQSPVLPAPSPAAAYGACTNPFATAAVAQPALPPTNPFQSNGFAPGTFAVGSPGSFSASPLSGVFSSALQQPLFPPQATLGPQQNGGAPFGGFPVAKAGQRPAGQLASISTNPFVTPMVTAPAVPFALLNPPPTNPFL
ncbi:hypothetical protein lerEdw1_006372 [Lerista edwardsae]|nr:hypothetical protein lerEdw1_006372 [Lerista edwardsae]